MVNIEEPIKEYIIKEFLFDKPEITLKNDLPLIEQGIVDSLGIFLLISFLEERFQVRIQPEDVVLENFATVDAIENLVMAKMAGGSK